MNKLISATAGIKFKPKDPHVDIPISILEVIERKTIPEELTDVIPTKEK